MGKGTEKSDGKNTERVAIPSPTRLWFLTMLANAVRISRVYPQGVHVAAGGQKPWLANVVGMERR